MLGGHDKRLLEFHSMLFPCATCMHALLRSILYRISPRTGPNDLSAPRQLAYPCA
jgi:hypothetical protein